MVRHQQKCGQQKCGKRYTIKDRQSSISLIRYADDLVILHEDINVIEKGKQVITKWLNNIGLELSPSKTRIAHTLEEYNGEKKGFKFLGFYIYQFKAGKCISGKDSKKRKLGFKTYISPTQESIIKHYRKLAEVIDKHKGVSQEKLISKLNPIIIGWCNYFRPYQCKKHFQKVRHLIRWESTSQVGSECGYRWGKLDLSIRSVLCLNCNTEHDRDGNASKNIEKVGIGHCHDFKRTQRKNKTTTVASSSEASRITAPLGR